MKKIIVTLIVCVLVLMFTNESPSQLIKGYGIKLGLTSADQKFNYSAISNIETKRRLGFISGVYVEWLDIPFISVITEMDYVQRGMGQEFIETAATGPEPIGKKHCTHDWTIFQYRFSLKPLYPEQ